MRTVSYSEKNRDHMFHRREYVHTDVMYTCARSLWRRHCSYTLDIYSESSISRISTHALYRHVRKAVPLEYLTDLAVS